MRDFLQGSDRKNLVESVDRISRAVPRGTRSTAGLGAATFTKTCCVRGRRITKRQRCYLADLSFTGTCAVLWLRIFAEDFAVPLRPSRMRVTAIFALPVGRPLKIVEPLLRAWNFR